MEQAMESTAGSLREIHTIDQYGLVPPHRHISHHARTGGATTDDDDVGF